MRSARSAGLAYVESVRNPLRSYLQRGAAFGELDESKSRGGAQGERGAQNRHLNAGDIPVLSLLGIPIRMHIYI